VPQILVRLSESLRDLELVQRLLSRTLGGESAGFFLLQVPERGCEAAAPPVDAVLRTNIGSSVVVIQSLITVGCITARANWGRSSSRWS
jgi:hypothetical protein